MLLLAGPAQDRYRRSARLLVAGIADALDDRQRDRCHELFDRIPQADATAAVRQEVTRIKQAADDRLNNAVDALRRDPERVELRATIREVVATELPRVVRTAELARRSRLATTSVICSAITETRKAAAAIPAMTSSRAPGRS